MYNLLISLAIGLAVGAAIALGTSFGWAAAVFPALLAATIAYFVLARRTWKQLEAVFEAMQADVRAQKLDKAVQTLQGGFGLAPWQFLVASQLHSNIGILLYVRQDLDAALPHLEKSFSRNWIARGMLGVLRYKRRDLDGMKRVFEDAVKTSKKEGVLWSAYAWILEELNRHEDAIGVLGRARPGEPLGREAEGLAPAPAERQEAEAREGLRRAVVPVHARASAAAVRRRPGLPRRQARHLRARLTPLAPASGARLAPDRERQTPHVPPKPTETRPAASTTSGTRRSPPESARNRFIAAASFLTSK